MEKIIVFEVLTKDSNIKIERIENKEIGFDYFLILEMKSDAENRICENEPQVFDNFYEPFDFINQKYQWYDWQLIQINEDFRVYAAEELVKVLNQNKIDNLIHYEDLQDKLQCFFYTENIPEKEGLKNIVISSLVKIIEHSYQDCNDSLESELDAKYKWLGSYEIWTEDQPYSIRNMELINENNSFTFLGKLEVLGQSIILKDNFGEIRYVLPADKYFISVSPVNTTKVWSVLLW